MALYLASFEARVDKMGMGCSVDIWNSKTQPAYFRFDIIYLIGTSEEVDF